MCSWSQSLSSVCSGPWEGWVGGAQEWEQCSWSISVNSRVLVPKREMNLFSWSWWACAMRWRCRSCLLGWGEEGGRERERMEVFERQSILRSCLCSSSGSVSLCLRKGFWILYSSTLRSCLSRMRQLVLLRELASQRRLLIVKFIFYIITSSPLFAIYINTTTCPPPTISALPGIFPPFSFSQSSQLPLPGLLPIQILTLCAEYNKMKPRGAKQEQPFDYLMKVIIIGDSGVGKSNILLRYSEGKFVQNYMMTIGINYIYKIIDVEGTRIKLQIWDTAGQDKYKTITKNYYRNSQGVLIVYGVDSRDSFYSVRNWMEDLTQTVGQGTQVMIVGNKMDLGEKREVSREEAEELAKHCQMPYMQCSAKSGQSVNQIFTTLAQRMKQRIIDNTEVDPQGGNPIVQPQQSNSKCCN